LPVDLKIISYNKGMLETLTQKRSSTTTTPGISPNLTHRDPLGGMTHITAPTTGGRIKTTIRNHLVLNLTPGASQSQSSRRM
jgi:hypothetical protein